MRFAGRFQSGMERRARFEFAPDGDTVAAPPEDASDDAADADAAWPGAHCVVSEPCGGWTRTAAIGVVCSGDEDDDHDATREVDADDEAPACDGGCAVPSATRAVARVATVKSVAEENSGE